MHLRPMIECPILIITFYEFLYASKMKRYDDSYNIYQNIYCRNVLWDISCLWLGLCLELKISTVMILTQKKTYILIQSVTPIYRLFYVNEKTNNYDNFLIEVCTIINPRI